MLNTVLLSLGDTIGEFGCYAYSIIIAGGILFCMAKYLKPSDK